MERFLVARYGEHALAAWAQAIAEVHRDVEPDHGRGAADPVHRIARQAELYGSDYEFDDGPDTGDATRAALTITHCAIWTTGRRPAAPASASPSPPRARTARRPCPRTSGPRASSPPTACAPDPPATAAAGSHRRAGPGRRPHRDRGALMCGVSGWLDWAADLRTAEPPSTP